MGKLVYLIIGGVWVCEVDIVEDVVIKVVLSEVGFDLVLVDKGLFIVVEIYECNLEDVVNVGVFGVLFYIMDGDEWFWG